MTSPDTKQVLDLWGRALDAIGAGDLDAIDTGALSRAHELEAVGFLQLTLAATENISWTGGLAVAR